MMLYVIFSLLILNGDVECLQPRVKLVGTHIIYRHGDRSPIGLYPTSNSSPSYWPNGLGQLTHRGQVQQIRLGQYLRERYSELLNLTYVAAENLYNISPSWANPFVLDQLKHILDLSFFYRFSSPEASRLRGGPIISDIMENVKSLMTNKLDGRKAKIYSGHDTTIAGVLSFFGVNYAHPPYCSALFFDLYHVEGW
ncbi:unnamed protein product [Rotaria sp. Silwood2]|nr:unnamed protein product [Rotaria sp. Silwood2]CAF3951657.1 unnamed protein product [Rotaria sp. Silwood2]